MPRLRFPTPIAIVQHHRETVKPTNTGRLFARMVEGTALMTFGGRDSPFDAQPLGDPSVEWFLLFPRQGAPVLDPGERPPEGRRRGFVVLDGTWKQGARMSYRVPAVASLPCRVLPPGPPSLWTVRTQHRRDGLSSFEAALRALELTEGLVATAPLREAFVAINDRYLSLKGRPGARAILEA